MRTYDEWHIFFQNIDKDPSQITPRLTVRELLAAREHVHQCEECMAIVDRVLENAPPKSIVNDANLN